MKKPRKFIVEKKKSRRIPTENANPTPIEVKVIPPGYAIGAEPKPTVKRKASTTIDYNSLVRWPL